MVLCSFQTQSQTYNFQFFNVQEGLPQSKVNALLQDSRGFLWIGTAGGGICKFDGKNFTQYSSKDGIAGDIITDIVEDNDHNIWFTASWGGVTKFDGRKFTIYENDAQQSNIGGNDNIFCDSKGRIWIAEGSKVKIYKNGVFNPISASFQKYIKNQITDIFEDSKHNIWISTHEGIIYCNESDTIEITKESGLPNNHVTTIYEDVDGNYVIGTHSSGAIKLLKGSIDSKKDFEFYPIHLGSTNIIVTSVTTDRDKNTVIATSNHGLFFINQHNIITHITKDNGLETNNLSKLLKDKSGNLWIGTNGYGLSKLGNIAFTYFDGIEGLNSASIFAILVDKNTIWIGTGDEGVFKYENRTLTNYTTLNGMGGNIIRSIVKDKGGVIWFATDGGLTKLENAKFSTFTTKNGLPTNAIRTLMYDKKENLWIGTSGGGLSVMKNGAFKNYGNNEGLTHNYIHSLFEDKKGNVWIGTGNGIHKMTNNIITNYSNSSGICNTYIGSITQDDFGDMWFGTDRCVVRYDGVDFKSMTTENGLSSNTIYFIFNDNAKNIWVGTNNGVDKISLNSYGQVERIKNYGFYEGFKGIECNSRAVFQDESDNIWMGTIKGLIKYNPKEDRTNVFQPIVRLDNIKLFLEDVNWVKKSKITHPWTNLPKDLTLDYSDNHLTFEYSAINLTNPEYVQYSFKLEPFDKDWYKSTKKTSVTYSNLPPGEYTFYLKARNNDGIWTNEPTTYSFTIKTPFWQTWWFYLFVFIGFIYLLLKISTIRERRQRKISKELERKVRERTILIEQQRDEKEILLKEIHHRVKNNLQVINSLLSLQSNYTNDEKSLALFDEAKNRIRSMALIHEKMYQSGDLAHIDFQDYIVALTNDLISTYSINCDIFLDIKIDEVKFNIDTIIPLGLLINEIISNTLKYAFIDRKKGTITIHLTKKEDNLFVLIAGDNGKGMPIEKFEGESPSLGLELIKVFTEQLDGEITRLETEGTIYELKFHRKSK
ncbi:MAG: two-component regulator propeller domain-containing protein [Flavobacteriales bacterium]